MIRILLLGLFLLNFGLYLGAQTKGIIPGEVLIQLEIGKSIESVFNSRNSNGIISLDKRSTNLNIYQINHDEKELSYEELSSYLAFNSSVEFFMQNREVELRQIPNDDHFDKQWNLSKIGVEKAWDVTTGGTTAAGDEIVVAILDSGYDKDLLDLFPNISINLEEEEGDANSDGCPGICGVDDDLDGLIDEDKLGREPGDNNYDTSYKDDDDENGYIDDRLGLNLDDGTDNHPALNHGTAVAGLIGAVGNNNLGVTGVNWRVKLLLLSEVGNVGEIIEAYEYIYEKRRLYNASNGEKGEFVVVTNFSSGIDKEFGSDFPMWCQMYDLLGSVGVLSVGATTNKNTNVDEEGDMPTTCPSKYLIAVTNLNKEDNQPNSGYGAENVDIGAPGNGAITLGLGETDNVGQFSGTSSATPHVTGAIALLYSIPCPAFIEYFKSNPSSVNELKDYILANVDPIIDLQNRTTSEGRLNIYNTMLALTDFCPSSSVSDLSISTIYPNPSYLEEITIKYDGPQSDENYELLVFDIVGRLVYSKSFVPPLYGDRVIRFSPQEMDAGVYIIAIRTAKEIVARKHVIVPY